MTVAGIQKLCDRNLAIAESILKELRHRQSQGGALLFSNTFGRFDDAKLAIFNASEFPYLLGVTHPDPAMRRAARLCEAKTDALLTRLYFDKQLAQLFKRFAKKQPKLKPERQRFVTETLRDFGRNGLDLPAQSQQRLRAINKRLTELGQRFIAEIANSSEGLELLPRQLAGLPEAFISSHPPGNNGRIRITTNYTDYFPFVSFATDRRAAKQLYIKFVNRGGTTNVHRLEKILGLRHEKAQLLGYATWADYAIEPRMARTAAAAKAYLARIRAVIAPRIKQELATFRSEFVAVTGMPASEMGPPDLYFLRQRLKARHFKLDSAKLAEYFDVSRVSSGLFDLAKRMYGLSFRRHDAQLWHPEVQAYAVHRAGKQIATIYLDLHPRPAKYKHAAMFSIRTAKTFPSGLRQRPMAALVCNFPRAGEPMQHGQVVTYFHEFGHLLHHILGQSELATYAGTNTVRDFVEAPSQMFEEWAWSPEVLQLITQGPNNEVLPVAIVEKMRRARGLGLALATERQLFLAQLDLALHSTPPGFDSSSLLAKIHQRNFSFGRIQGTHAQSSFSHLISYDAAYYSYQWSLAFAHDVLTRFKREGLLNPVPAEAWRKHVLSRGGSADERKMLNHFLGRDPSVQAYVDFLNPTD